MTEPTTPTAASITVRVNGTAVGDGQAIPPVVGQQRTYHLSFHEVRTIFIDSGLYGEARWIDAHADHGRQDTSRASTWFIPLAGPGWTAMWTANRPHHGPAHLYGYLQTEMSVYAPDPVTGTVTAVRGHWADITLNT